MTEADWERCAEPQDMLDYLEATRPAGDRKLRLFAVACCRRIRTFLTDERSRVAVEVSERHADRLASAAEVEEARQMAQEAAARRQAARGAQLGQRAWRTHRVAEQAAWSACYCLGDFPRCAGTVARSTLVVADLRGLAYDTRPGHWQCHLLREVFGNPFRPPAVDPFWLRWGAGCVTRLARAVYDGRRFGDLPVVADALEEAGCSDADLLAHCRGPGPHVRGCWALDLLLGQT